MKKTFKCLLAIAIIMICFSTIMVANATDKPDLVTYLSQEFEIKGGKLKIPNFDILVLRRYTSLKNITDEQNSNFIEKVDEALQIIKEDESTNIKALSQETREKVIEKISEAAKIIDLVVKYDFANKKMEILYIDGSSFITLNIDEIVEELKTDINNCTITNASYRTYTGSAITPKVTVRNGNETLNEKKDYIVEYSNNINTGIATITVTGTGKYNGAKTSTFRITGKSAESFNTSKIPAQEYTGKPIMPSVTVTDGKNVLKQGKDYIISYKDNIKVGNALVTITGKGNYTATKIVKFKIDYPRVMGLKSVDQDKNTIKISWNKFKVSDYFEIYMSTNKDKNYKRIAKITDTKKTSYKKGGLIAGTKYYFKIKAYKKVSSKESYLSYSEILTTSTVTKSPTISKITSKSKNATINWKKVSSATGYEIAMSTSRRGAYNKIATITSKNTTTYNMKNLKKGKTYYFKVRTFIKIEGKKIYSVYSSEKSIKIK